MWYLKNSLIVFCLLLGGFANLHAQQDEYTYTYGNIPEGQTAYIFGDQVNIREAPTTTAKSLGKLKIGTKVTVKSQGVMHVVNGIAALWHEVQTGKTTGWVWGGFLSLTYRDMGDALLLYGLTRYSPDSNFFGEARLVKNGAILSKVGTQPFFTAWGPDPKYDYSVKNMLSAASGLNGIDEIWEVDFVYEACGYVTGGQFFAISGNKLIYVGESPCMSEAAVFHAEADMIFPWEEGGKPGQVINRSVISEFDEKLEDYKITETNDEVLIWDGKQFTKKP